MNPVETHGDWMSSPGSRRRTSGATTEDPAAIDPMTRESQRGDRPHPMELPKVDWFEGIRGILFFGILATVLWLEWVAITAIVTYVSTFF